MQRAQVGPEKVPDLAVAEDVMPRRHRRMRREDRRRRDCLERGAEGMAPRDALAHPLEHHQGRVPLVHVPDARLQPERADRAHAADAEDDFLAQPHVVAGIVKAGRDAPLLLRVLLDVRVEQEERYGPDFLAPEAGMHDAVRHRDRNAKFPAYRVEHRREPRGLGLELGRRRDLPSPRIEKLREIAGAVEEADRDERQPEIAGGLQVIPREHAEPARVDRQALVDRVLRAEVRNQFAPAFRLGPRAAHSLVCRAWPSMSGVTSVMPAGDMWKRRESLSRS